jgi:hypothetical protein
MKIVVFENVTPTASRRRPAHPRRTPAAGHDLVDAYVFLQRRLAEL